MRYRYMAGMLVGIAAVLAFIVVVVLPMWARDERVETERSVEEWTEEGSVSDGGEVGETMTVEGDAGIEHEDTFGIGSEMPVEVSAKTKEEMVALINRYLGYIPFADDGRFYGTGYFKSPDGVDNRIQSPVGMDSLGYVIWVYRNVFGSSSPIFELPSEWPREWMQISVDQLEIGDVGLSRDPLERSNHYGIFIGYDYGFPVFAHCSGMPAPKYPCGNDRLSFLRSATSSYHMGNPTVEFNYFFRPPVEWEDWEGVMN